MSNESWTSEDTWGTLLGVLILAAMVGAVWFWWPQITSFLSHRPPGAPEPGMDCVEVDWDEWGRPLYDCRPPRPERPPHAELPPPPIPEP